jgi:predicted AAA+ superfamily ATPase
MIPRWIASEIKKRILQVPAVALLGARQVGKTTLAKTIAKGLDSVYLDLEAPEDLLKLHDPAAFLRVHSDKLVILDEIQRAPNLFPVLRGLIDENREKGCKTGQFFFLGSASMELMRQTSESLAGRISYLYMGGLNLLETGTESNTIRNLWVRGGFPESYLASDDAVAMDWLEDLIRTYLERDLPQLGFRVPATRMRRLWTMLAHLQGEPVNYSKLGTNLEIDGKTVGHYIDILSDLLLVRRLEPWHANVKKRLIKTPRYYIRDSGVLHRLLGIGGHDALLCNPVLGKSWEGFVVENIHSALPRRAETYFYRTAAGAEIDLIIRMPSSEIWAVEIKYGTAPKLGRHYSAICDDVGASRKYIVYGGDDEFPVGNDVSVISLPRFLEKVGSIGV